jgi:hypothetical protein
MCLGVNAIALVLNRNFRKLGCHWRRWLWGIYSLQPLSSCWLSLLAMGTPESLVVHRTGTVHCPVCATSSRLLGFGAVDRWSFLSCSCTGQSSATPLTSALWLLPCTVHFCSRPLVPGSCCFVGSPNMSSAHRTVRCATWQHILKSCSKFIWVPNLNSFLVCVEPYAPEINDI